jgi:hypothetical protein
VAARGLAIGGVVLDAGFDSGETILLLQQRGLSYAVPLRKKGNGTNRRNECYAQPSGTIGTMEWTTEKSRRARPLVRSAIRPSAGGCGPPRPPRRIRCPR